MKVEERKKQLKRRAVAGGLIVLTLCGIVIGHIHSKKEVEQSVLIEDTEDILLFDMEEVEVETRSLGEYCITAYCTCNECTDGDGLTALNKPPVEGRTVAVDPSVIPFGTVLVIDGHEYVAEDSGVGWIEGKELDIFFESHEAAKEFGVQWSDVYVKEE